MAEQLAQNEQAECGIQSYSPFEDKQVSSGRAECLLQSKLKIFFRNQIILRLSDDAHYSFGLFGGKTRSL